MSGWDKRRENDILELMAWLENKGANQGVALTRPDIAAALDWPLSKLDRIVRYIKEHPETGFGITLTVSSKPWVVASTTQMLLSGVPIDNQRTVSRGEALKAIMTIGRYVAMEAVQYKNIAGKGTSEARRAQMTKREHRNLLVGIQNVLDTRRDDESAVVEFLETVLENL